MHIIHSKYGIFLTLSILKFLFSDFWKFPHPLMPISNTTAEVNSSLMSNSPLAPSSLRKRKETNCKRTLGRGLMWSNPTVHFVGHGIPGQLRTASQASVWCFRLSNIVAEKQSHGVSKEISEIVLTCNTNPISFNFKLF